MIPELQLSNTDDKEVVFTAIQQYLSKLSLHVTTTDSTRPWGGFFVIEEADTDNFIAQYFPTHNLKEIKQFGSKLSPKILVVGPGEELSWQYHHRRAELWSCVAGPVSYMRSNDDVQRETTTLTAGESVQFNPEERHRLIGQDHWGVVAEFWQHTDPENPSEESDIVRLDDKYGR